MGIQIDLIVPPIIVGLLIILIFRMNAFIMETSVDNRLNNDMQMFADLTSRLIQEEVKTAGKILTPDHPDNPSPILEFIVENVEDTVWIQQSGRNLEIIRRSNIPPAIPDTIIYPSSLDLLEFDLERKPGDDIMKEAHYLNIKIQTESNPAHHASMRDLDKTVRGFAENEIYLRNVHRKSL